MIPISLEIENFGKHGKSSIPFNDFSAALVIGKKRGNDKTANGVGKSTIFSAIKYVLFNKAESSTLEGAIRKGTDACKVTFDFRAPLDNEIYRIVRSLSSKSGSDVRLYKQTNDTWDDITQRRNSDTEKEISKLIKINHKTFSNSVLFSQADLSGLASLTPAHRKTALKEALQLNVYSKYEILAKKQASDISKEIDAEKVILKTLGAPKEDIEKFEKELVDVADTLSVKSNDLSAKTKDLASAQEAYAVAVKQLETLANQASEFITKQSSLTNEVDKLSQLVSDYKLKLSSIEESGKTIVAENKSLTTQLNKLNALSFRDKPLIAADFEISTKQLIEIKALINSKLSKLEELRIPLPTGTICKHCRGPIIDRDACQKSIDDDIKETQAAIKLAKTSITELELRCKSLNDELKTLEMTSAKIMTTQNAIEVKSTEIETKRSLHSEFTKLCDEGSLLLQLKTQELNELNKQKVDAYQDIRRGIKSDISSHKDTIDQATSHIQSINQHITTLSNNKAVLTHRITERLKDVEKQITSVETISNLEAKFIIHQKVIQAFGSTGIPALITHTILDDFQAESNLWLSKLRPGLQLQFSVTKDRNDGNEVDTLDISYILEGNEFEYAQLSGSQKLLVALSLKLGLANVIKKRLGVELGLLLIDEVDSSLDEESLEALESAIKQLQQEFKVLVITHNNELKTKFNHAILVEQDENLISSAKVVTTW